MGRRRTEPAPESLKDLSSVWYKELRLCCVQPGVTAALLVCPPLGASRYPSSLCYAASLHHSSRRQLPASGPASHRPRVAQGGPGLSRTAPLARHLLPPSPSCGAIRPSRRPSEGLCRQDRKRKPVRGVWCAESEGAREARGRGRDMQRHAPRQPGSEQCWLLSNGGKPEVTGDAAKRVAGARRRQLSQTINTAGTSCRLHAMRKKFRKSWQRVRL